MGQNQAETKIVVAISRGVVIAIRYTTVRRIIVPTSATINTVRALQPSPVFVKFSTVKHLSLHNLYD